LSPLALPERKIWSREEAQTEEEAIERTYTWSERKKGFDRKQIAVAREILLNQGWLV
jgi:hypothetical protein